MLAIHGENNTILKVKDINKIMKKFNKKRIELKII